MLSKLRWGAFGLRGRIIGAVVVTTAVTLGVAGLVLLPKLEGSLQNASKTTLKNDVKAAFKKGGELRTLNRIHYQEIAILAVPGVNKRSPAYVRASNSADLLAMTEQKLRLQLGAESLLLIGYIDQTGHGQPIVPAALASAGGGVTSAVNANDALTTGSLDDVQAAHATLEHELQLRHGPGQPGGASGDLAAAH